ncbi:hypothetical protein PR048_007527 [Dryococelus australis]|uniref:Uncharacterized protein n=1 Tax=Dryococelus australis TaxID=614101 RepID=A0ABQ9HUH0_9NEOP|nr:hypothetical protein PR048_007527 [Dryococelus australis]
MATLRFHPHPPPLINTFTPKSPAPVTVRSSGRPRNERAGETGDPRENSPTSDIVRHDSHIRKCRATPPGIEPGSPWWEATEPRGFRHTLRSWQALVAPGESSAFDYSRMRLAQFAIVHSRRAISCDNIAALLHARIKPIDRHSPPSSKNHQQPLDDTVTHIKGPHRHYARRTKLARKLFVKQFFSYGTLSANQRPETTSPYESPANTDSSMPSNSLSCRSQRLAPATELTPSTLCACCYSRQVSGVVVRLLACHPGELARFLAGNSRIFTRRNRAGRCHWSTSCLEDLLFLPLLHSEGAPYLPRVTLIGSRDLEIKAVSEFAWSTYLCVPVPGRDAVRAVRTASELERASQKESSDTHETYYDRVKRCRERKINIKASERVNVDVFKQNKRSCPQHRLTPCLSLLGRHKNVKSPLKVTFRQVADVHTPHRLHVEAKRQVATRVIVSLIAHKARSEYMHALSRARYFTACRTLLLHVEAKRQVATRVIVSLIAHKRHCGMGSSANVGPLLPEKGLHWPTVVRQVGGSACQLKAVHNRQIPVGLATLRPVLIKPRERRGVDLVGGWWGEEFPGKLLGDSRWPLRGGKTSYTLLSQRPAPATTVLLLVPL